MFTPNLDHSRLAALNAKIEQVRQAYDAARADLHATLNEGFGALPHPDGMLRSQRVIRAYHKALREHTDALFEMNNYLLGLSIEDGDR